MGPSNRKAQVIDPTKLKDLEVVQSKGKPGHKSIVPKDRTKLPEWQNNPNHSFTQEVREAIIGAINRGDLLKVK